MNARSRVAAVIVTHHSAAVIGPCLDSIRGMGRIIVVDNASDDDDMCMRMAAAGHCPVLVPSAVAERRGGGSVRPSAGYYWEKFWHMAWSRLYIEEKYHGAAAMRLANALTYALKAVGHGLTLNRA